MNIEEFVNDYLQEHRHEVLLNPYNGLVEFAEALKAEALKEAVEKTVGQLERQWGGNIHFMHGFEVDEMDFPFLNSQECGYGDKVRIVVLRED